MATAPLFFATAFAAHGQISAANTNLDGSGTLATIVSAQASALKIERIGIKAEATTTAGMVRLFLDDGSNTWLWREVDVSAITPSATVKAFSAEVDLSQAGDVLVLPAGWLLKAATEKAETFTVHVVGGLA